MVNLPPFVRIRSQNDFVAAINAAPKMVWVKSWHLRAWSESKHQDLKKRNNAV